MRPAFALYAEYLDGTAVDELATKHGLRQETVVTMLNGVRLCLQSEAPRLRPEEASRFRGLAA